MFFFCNGYKELKKLIYLTYEGLIEMTNIADNVIDLQVQVAALQAAVAALNTNTQPVDLAPTNALINAVQVTVDDIDAKVTPTVTP